MSQTLNVWDVATARFRDMTSDDLRQFSAGSFLNIAGAATTVVKSGAGTLVSAVINRTVALGVVTIYDNTAGSGTKIATITQPAAVLASQANLPYNAAFSTGLTVVTSLADDITIIFK